MQELNVSESVRLRIRRIHRLSMRPPNPGVAYRHLEHIKALCESLLMEFERVSPPSSPPGGTPGNEGST